MTVSEDLTTYRVLLVHYVIGDGAMGSTIVINANPLRHVVVSGGYTDSWAATLSIEINFTEPSITLKTNNRGWNLDQIYVQGIYGFIYA